MPQVSFIKDMAGIEVQRDPLAGMETVQNSRSGGDPVVDMSPLQLSEKESEILELYDRLEEIRLETSLLRAQGTVSDAAEIVSEQALQKASEGLLEAKARYTLRNTIVESVLITNPILNAIHAGVNATPIERDLLPLIEERDKLSVTLTETTAKVLAATEDLTKLEAEHIVVVRRNVELATRVMALAAEVKLKRTDDIRDPVMRAQLDELEGSVKISRHRWRIMKGTASAIVAGSGVDWSRDPLLRDLVLDPEDD